LNKTVVIRTEASSKIGFGHLGRCLALNESISKEANVIFFTSSEAVLEKCKRLNLNYLYCSCDIEGIEQLKSENPNLIINSFLIDKKEHYSKELVAKLQNKCQKVFFIENNSIGTLLADGVIYPAAHFDYKTVYSNCKFKMPSNKIIHGIEYVLIRDIFKSQKCSNGGGIVVTTGASDPNKVMYKIDEKLASLKLKAHFLLGEGFNYKLGYFGKKFGSTYSKYSPTHIAKSDIIISTFGVSVYEAIFLSKPIISIGHNEENSVGSSILAKNINQVLDLGFFKDINVENLSRLIKDCYELKKSTLDRVIDGKGALRITKLILQDD